MNKFSKEMILPFSNEESKSNNLKLLLEKFDHSRMNENPLIHIISEDIKQVNCLIRNLLSVMEIDVGMAVSSNRDEVEAMKEYMPSSFIHDQFDRTKLNSVIDCITKENIKSLVMLMNCLTIHTDEEDVKVLEKLFSVSKKHGCTVINKVDLITAGKSPCVVNAEIGLCGYLFIGGDAKKCMQCLLSAFFFKHFETFEELYKQYTEDGSWLVIDLSKRDCTQLKEYIYWYGTTFTPQFKLCNELVWELDSEIKEYNSYKKHSRFMTHILWKNGVYVYDVKDEDIMDLNKMNTAKMVAWKYEGKLITGVITNWLHFNGFNQTMPLYNIDNVWYNSEYLEHVIGIRVPFYIKEDFSSCQKIFELKRYESGGYEVNQLGISLEKIKCMEKLFVCLNNKNI